MNRGIAQRALHPNSPQGCCLVAVLVNDDPLAVQRSGVETCDTCRPRPTAGPVGTGEHVIHVPRPVHGSGEKHSYIGLLFQMFGNSKWLSLQPRDGFDTVS